MKTKFKLIGAVLAVAACAGAYVAFAATRHYEHTENAYVKVDRVVVSPKVGGYVVAVPIQDNQQVRAGDVLIRIETADFEARLAQERATLLSREAALEAMSRRKDLNRAEISQASWTVDSAAAQAVKSVSDQQRDQKLLQNGYTTLYQSEVSQLNARVATSGEARARAQLDATHKQTSMLDAQLIQLRAEIQQARATLDLLGLDLKNATIVAPADGVVGNKTVDVGQYVRAGTQLLTLVSMRPAHVIANFKETQLATLKLKQPVSLHVDAFPDLELTGHIESIAPATGSEFSLLPPENATGNFTKIVQRIPVRITLDPHASLALLRSGMSVSVRVDTREHAAPAAKAAQAATPPTQVAGTAPALGGAGR